MLCVDEVVRLFEVARKDRNDKSTVSKANAAAASSIRDAAVANMPPASGRNAGRGRSRGDGDKRGGRRAQRGGRGTKRRSTGCSRHTPGARGTSAGDLNGLSQGRTAAREDGGGSDGDTAGVASSDDETGRAEVEDDHAEALARGNLGTQTREGRAGVKRK